VRILDYCLSNFAINWGALFIASNGGSDVGICYFCVVLLVISELRNDHEEITEKLNRNIEVLHSARLTPKQSSLKDSDGQSASVVNMVASASSTNVHTGSTNAMDVDVIVSVPFALVDEISDASPAAEDGLQLGDPCNTWWALVNISYKCY
ncbi:hypothetical protein DVH24_000514, partial [Malus domestica]